MTARARCACGRARRAAAEKCQRCLDTDRAAAIAAEPARLYARDWRRLGYLCAIIDGAVHLSVRLAGGAIHDEVHVLPIDAGRWSRVVELADWTTGVDARRLELLRAIARDCYCVSFPETGCDFCNGIRLPDGKRQTVAR